MWGLYETFIGPEILLMEKEKFNQYYASVEPYFERILKATDLYTKYYWILHAVSAVSGLLLEKMTAKTFSYWRASVYYAVSYSFTASLLANTAVQMFGDVMQTVIVKLKKHHAEINSGV